MDSKLIACWPDLGQPWRDEQSIRMSRCADAVSDKVICSCPTHSNAIVCWRGLFKQSPADKHSSAYKCQVISGNVIVFCPLITVSVLPPNRRVQSTPLRGRKIVAILKSGFVPKLISLYQCGAADAQHVRRLPSPTHYLICPCIALPIPLS